MTVYILHSKSLDRHYTGFSKSLQKRLHQHQAETNHWTARASDWKLIWKKEVSDTVAARHLETRIKSRGAKRFLQETIVPPEAG